MNTFGYHVLSLPAVLLSASVVLVPACITFYAAFTKWNGMSTNMEWIGLENFQKLFHDWIFWKALGNNFKWTLMFISIPVLIAMLSAMLLVRLKKGRDFFQTIYLIPYLLAPTTNAIIWLNIIFSPNAGLIGYLQRLGLQITSPLGNINTALGGVAMVDIWHYWGFLTVVYLAALRQTPAEQIEAAVIDGADAWQLFRYVYLPSILPTVRLMFVLIIIYSFLTFDYIYLLTWGGPAHATEMLSTLAYTLAFSTFKFGRAAAVSLVMGLFGSVAAFFYTWFSRKEALQ
ncbi:MAG: carbohydrate ABC transporter permease [Flexilinea sp.]